MKALIVLVLMVSVACAGEVWIKWDKTTDPNVLGYGKAVAKVAPYSSSNWRARGSVMGNQTTMYLYNFSSGKRHIHVIYSTTVAGKSAPSDLVRIDMPPSAPKTLKVLVIQTTPIIIKEEQ